jgi:hypothetical protein
MTFYPATYMFLPASTYTGKAIALPQAILSQLKKKTNNQNIYIIDRGLKSTIKDEKIQ